VTSRDLEIGGKDRILVVAPHPDDESLGCGGLIALARRRGLSVWVVFMTDGSGSHRSSTVTRRRLGTIRRREAAHALFLLGVRPAFIIRMGLKDRFVAPGRLAGEGAAARARRMLEDWRPSLLVIPSKDDRHGDHRATAAIWQLAARRATCRLRQIDYSIWPGRSAAEHSRLTLDITPVRYLKRQAIRAHRSQHGLVIRDDPAGFVLPSVLLANATRSLEIYDEKIS